MPEVHNQTFLIAGAILGIFGLALLLFGGSNSAVQGDNGSVKEQIYALTVELMLIAAGVVGIVLGFTA